MGIELIREFKSRCKKEYVWTFLVAFIGGLLVHMYKFTNNLPNHDSMYSFYSDQNVVGSGRWFLSIACGFSSYYDLPWINGILSILFIALTAVIVVSVLGIKNPVAITISGGLLVTYPAITETLCFEFTADGYMLSMLLSALSVFAIIRAKNNAKAILCSALFLCLSCAIYQAYVSFAIVLFLCWLILKAFEIDFKFKNNLRYITSYFSALIIGLAVYYGVWKLCLLIQGVPANDYQGINGIGFLGLSEIISAIKSMAVAFFSILFEKNIFKHGISLYGLLNILFILFSVIILIVAIAKSKLFKSISRWLTVGISALAFPFAVCMWQFVSSEVAYSLRMMQSVVLFYILFVVLCERYLKGNFSLVYAVLNFIIIINLAVQANVAYYYLNYEYENSFAEAVRLEYALEQVYNENGNKYKIAIIGHRETEVALDQATEANGCFMYTNMIEKSLLIDEVHTQNFLENVLYFEGEFVDPQTRFQIEQTEEYKAMKSWFDGGDIKIIDNIITVKLG